MVTKKTAEASKATNKQDAAGRRIAKKGEPQHALYVEKAIPLRIQEFVDYLSRETGYEVDPRSVYLGSALRGAFQKSPENQERIVARASEIARERVEREAARKQREENKIAKAAARAEKAEAAKAAKATKDAEAKEAKDAEAKAPTKKAAPAKKAPAKAKAAPATTRRRPARTAKAEEEDF